MKVIDYYAARLILKFLHKGGDKTRNDWLSNEPIGISY